ncbi:hypothetical protein Q9966_004312 [Columba livia]|nr:hypothetical protein Q9966_004312 [Columba livia]
MKCFSRYLPYLFRPPSAILSASCHAEGLVIQLGIAFWLRLAIWEPRGGWIWKELTFQNSSMKALGMDTSGSHLSDECFQLVTSVIPVLMNGLWCDVVDCQILEVMCAYE